MEILCGESLCLVLAKIDNSCTTQPYALALCLLSIFVIFVLELIAFRWGKAKLAKLELTYGTNHFDYRSPFFRAELVR